MRTPELLDSRRLTGPNLIGDSPGAVIDCRIEGDADAFLDAWRLRARQILDAVGWTSEVLGSRVFPGGVSVYHSAPVDALYAATELNEWAWATAAADLGAGDGAEPLSEAAPRLAELIDEEKNPSLLTLKAAADRQEITFLSDDDEASVGLGAGSQAWSVSDLPAPSHVPWPQLRDIPRVLITGTNGKTTSVRMLAEIVREAGRRVGFTCTDGIHVDGVLLEGGDWSGPGGARTLLRDRRVEVAILETARGGILRRGLALDRVQAALVTNVAEDHLGEWGIATVEDVASAKLIVAKAVRHGAPLVINADDPVLALAARALERPITWIALEHHDDLIHVRADEVVWTVTDGWITRQSPTGHGLDRSASRVVQVVHVPATLGGAATFNIYNALGAAALAFALGLDDAVIRRGLVAFDPTPEQSPGRTNLFEVQGVKILVDFVHNPHGFAAIGSLVEALAPLRLGLMVGHAGDRDDRAIRDLARAAWALRPDRIAVKEIGEYRRGREPGEVPELIRSELVAAGAPTSTTSLEDDELTAARALLDWSRPGDLVLLSTQAQRAEVLDLVQSLEVSGWRPGTPLPKAQPSE